MTSEMDKLRVSNFRIDKLRMGEQFWEDGVPIETIDGDLSKKLEIATQESIQAAIPAIEKDSQELSFRDNLGLQLRHVS